MTKVALRGIASRKLRAFTTWLAIFLGLAFYATPSTDAALSALPDDQAGSGAGIYKMASSLGASFGGALGVSTSSGPGSMPRMPSSGPSRFSIFIFLPSSRQTM